MRRLTLAALGLLWAGTSAADSFETALRNFPGNPPDVDCELAYADDRDFFYWGEIVDMELRITWIDSKEERREGRVGGGSGRGIGQIRPFVRPAALTRDPREDYGAAMPAQIGAGLGGYGTSDNTLKTRLRLNDYFAFSEPGTYQVGVAYLQASPSDSRERGTRVISAVCNGPPLTIREPSPDWEQRAIDESTAVLDSDASPHVKVEAARRLGRLTSVKAARAAIERFGRGGPVADSTLAIGLLSSPRRSEIVEILESRFEHPEQPVTLDYAATLLAARLAVLRAAEGFSFEDLGHEYWTRLEVVRDSLWRRIAASLPRKVGPAKASTVVAAVEIGQHFANSTEARALAVAGKSALVETFPDLPRDEQIRLLQDHWYRVRDPALIPHLRRIFAETYESDPTDEFRAHQIRNRRTLVLRRLSELDPAFGRQQMLKGLRDPPLNVAPEAFFDLPPEAIPEADEPFVRMLISQAGSNIRTVAPLVEKFATSSVREAAAIALAEPAAENCQTRAALLSFLLRVDPENGRVSLEESLRSDDPLTSDCRASLLIEISTLRDHPGLEGFAVALLNDQDLHVAGRAAEWLGRYGSEEGLDQVWKRFERFSEEWRGREDEIEALSLAEEDFSRRPPTFETALARAIMSRDREGLQKSRLQALCVSRACRSETGAADRR